jgi:hypothetical protein
MFGDGAGDFNKRIGLVQCDLPNLRTRNRGFSGDRANEIATTSAVAFSNIQEEPRPVLLRRDSRLRGARGRGRRALDLLSARHG